MNCTSCKRSDRPPYRKGECNNCYQARRSKERYIPRGAGGKYSNWWYAHPERLMWLGAKHHARKLHVAFTIKDSDIVIPEFCPVLGIRLEKAGKRDSSPSLDRVVGKLGYTPSNVRVISQRANRIKSDASLEELECIVEYIKLSMSDFVT